MGVKPSVCGQRGGGGGRAVDKKEAHVRERVDVARPSAASCLEEDLRNAFIMRWRFTAELVKLYFTSNNTSSKQGGREQVQVGSHTSQSEP